MALPLPQLKTALALPPPQLITAMVLPPQPPPRLLMNTSLPVRMSPPPSPTPPPMTPASVQTSQTRSGLRTVLAPASLTATARQASRTRSSQTTAAWTATAAPPHMTPPQCPVCQVMRLHCEESEKNILLETLRKNTLPLFLHISIYLNYLLPMAFEANMSILVEILVQTPTSKSPKLVFCY